MYKGTMFLHPTLDNPLQERTFQMETNDGTVYFASIYIARENDHWSNLKVTEVAFHDEAGYCFCLTEIMKFEEYVEAVNTVNKLAQKYLQAVEEKIYMDRNSVVSYAKVP